MGKPARLGEFVQDGGLLHALVSAFLQHLLCERHIATLYVTPFATKGAEARSEYGSASLSQ